MQARLDRVGVGLETLEARDDACHDPPPPVVEARDPGPRASPQDLRDAASERVEVEGRERRQLLAHAVGLEAQRRAHGEQSGEGARQAVEVGLHQGALLVFEELDVAVPDECLGRTARRRRRRRVLQDPATSVDRLEAGEERRASGIAQECSQPFDPVAGGGVGQVDPEDVVEDGVVRRPDRVHVRQVQTAPATEAAREVRATGSVGVQPKRGEREPDVVRSECRHAGPLEARGQVIGTSRRSATRSPCSGGTHTADRSAGPEPAPSTPDGVRRPTLLDELLGGDQVGLDARACAPWRWHRIHRPRSP